MGVLNPNLMLIGFVSSWIFLPYIFSANRRNVEFPTIVRFIVTLIAILYLLGSRDHFIQKIITIESLVLLYMTLQTGVKSLVNHIRYYVLRFTSVALIAASYFLYARTDIDGSLLYFVSISAIFFPLGVFAGGSAISEYWLKAQLNKKAPLQLVHVLSYICYLFLLNGKYFHQYVSKASAVIIFFLGLSFLMKFSVSLVTSSLGRKLYLFLVSLATAQMVLLYINPGSVAQDYNHIFYVFVYYSLALAVDFYIGIKNRQLKSELLIHDVTGSVKKTLGVTLMLVLFFFYCDLLFSLGVQVDSAALGSYKGILALISAILLAEITSTAVLFHGESFGSGSRTALKKSKLIRSEPKIFGIILIVYLVILYISLGFFTGGGFLFIPF